MKDINDFKNNIKNQDELLSLDEVKGIISTPTVAGAKWVKPTTFSLISIAILSVGIFFLNKNKMVTKSVDENGNIVVTTWANDQSKRNFDTANLNDSNTYFGFRSVKNYVGKTATFRESKETTSNSTQTKPSQLENSSDKPTTYRTTSDITPSIPAMPAEQNTVPTTKIAPSSIPTVNNTPSGPSSERYYYDAWEKEPQTFSISLDKPNVIQGEEGTIIIIPRGAICGTYESFTGEVKLTEYYKKEDMLLAQLSTGSGHNMLESAGMITLTAASDGQELMLCKDVTVLFPSDKYTDSSYIGFKGNWDDQHNIIDWEAYQGGNQNFFAGTMFPDCERPTYQSIRSSLQTRYDELRKPGRSNIRKEYRKDEVLRKIRKRFWFTDSTTSKLYDEVYQGIKHKMKDTMSASAYHECRIKQEKARALRNLLDSMRGENGFDVNVLNRETGYILANVSGFGSINCDRFTQYKDVKNHTYKVGGSEGALSSRLIFHDLKSILHGSQSGTDEIMFRQIPNGLRATLLVVKYADSSIQVAHQAMETGADPVLQFEKITKDELPSKLKAITAAIGNPKTEILERDYSAVLAYDDILGKAMSLTKEELEAFYIFQHDDILLFSRSREDQESLELIYRKGTSGSSYSINQKTPLRLISDEYPKAVVTTQTTLYKKWNTPWNEIHCEKYMPILVNFDHGIADYSVWWFETNEKNIAKLPERFKETYTQYCLQPTEVSSDTTYKKDEKKYLRKPKSPLVTPYSKDQLIIADKELIKALKINFTSKHLRYKKRKSLSQKKHYKRNFQRNFSILSGSIDYTDKYQKNTPPSFITFQDSNFLNITKIVSSNNNRLNRAQYFYAHKHLMIAVKIGTINNKEVVFWYENTKRLNELISEDDKTRTTEYLTTAKGLEMPIPEAKEQKQQLHFDEMQQFKALRSISINPVRLTPDELTKLDISQKDGDIYYTQCDKDYAFNFKFTKRFTITDFEKLEDDSKAKPFKPSFISDKYGKSYRMRTVSDSIDLDRLIPIYVGTEKEYRLSDYFNDYFHPDCIFWYEPTLEFLAALPMHISDQLTYELSLIEPKKETSLLDLGIESKDTAVAVKSQEKCVYLDPCSDIKTNLKGVKLYPNPTNAEVTLEITANKSVKGRISVTNLAGQELKAVTLDDIRNGTNIDLSDLPSGIYLVTLLTNDGDKITRRVIRE